MYNYLNNPHHVEVLSCGQRHMASVDISGLWDFLPYDADYYTLITSQSPVVNLIINHIKGLKPNWFGVKRKSVVLGNYKFTFKVSKQEGEHLSIKPVKGSDMFNSSNWCSNDVRFTSWFTQHYDFNGLGELEEQIYSLMTLRYNKVMMLCKTWFHTQIGPNVDRRNYNPEVCCRQITFAYWAALTMRSAIELRSYDLLPRLAHRNNVECVRAFEKIANSYNKTGFNYSEKYYNDESLKRDQKHAYDMCRKILNLK